MATEADYKWAYRTGKRHDSEGRMLDDSEALFMAACGRRGVSCEAIINDYWDGYIGHEYACTRLMGDAENCDCL